jgi:hypothetical protein
MNTDQNHRSRRRSIRGFLAQATALCLVSSTALAALVDSGPVNIVIPDDLDGLYFNVVTGVGAGTGGGAPGWDINPYSATAASFNLWGPTTNTWFNPDGIITGNYNLPSGTVVQGAAAAFFRPAGANGVGPQFTLNSSNNYLGFRFANEANAGAIHFGYIQVEFGATVSTRSIVRYVYDDVADTPVTIPFGDAAPTLTYDPTTAAGVTFPDGIAGTANASIAITASGAVGTGETEVSGCAISGAGAASFGAPTITPADGIFDSVTTVGSIDLTCTRAGAVATATLSCTETATPTVPGSPFTREWALTCPAATVVDVAPIASVPDTTLAAGSGTVTPVIDTPAEGTGSTLFECSIPATAPSNFTITSNATQTLDTGVPLGMDMTCVPQPAETTATLTCTQTATPGPNPPDATATITCPAGMAAVAPGVASGTTITLPTYALPSGSSSTSLTFTSTGNSAVVNCTATGAGFSAAPNPLNLADGVPGTLTITYTGATVGTFAGTLDCTTTGTGGPFTFPLGVTVGAGFVAPAVIPAMGSLGTWILILSALGFGLLVVGTRLRS